MELAKSNQPQTFSLQPLHDSKPVHGVAFSESSLVSVGFDGSFHFWACEGEFPNLAVVRCSKRPILQATFYNRGRYCAGAAADSFIYLVDSVESYSSIGTLKGHESYVNGICSMGENLLASSSDDFTLRLWDVRENSPITTIELKREVTSVCWSEQMPNQIFCGSLDNQIRCFDPRNTAQHIMLLKAHQDMVTGLSVSKDGRELVSSAVDGSICVWDSSPFCPGERLLFRIAHGLPAGDSISDRSLLRCSWTPDGRYFSAGSSSSSDFVVCMWTKKGQPFKAFPGHSGFVTEVAFHPSDNLMASCGMDGKLLVGNYL